MQRLLPQPVLLPTNRKQMSSRGAFESVSTQSFTILLQAQLKLKESVQLGADGFLFGHVQNIWCSLCRGP